MRLFAVMLLALLYAASVHAQTTPYNVANLSWTAVTTYDDSAPLADPVTYNVYAGRQGSAKSRVATGLTTTAITRTAIPLGIWCWNVTAVVKGVESVASDDVCKDVKQPAVPASIKPAATTLSFNPPDPAQVPAT
jgi:hypothetical protein